MGPDPEILFWIIVGALGFAALVAVYIISTSKNDIHPS